MPPPRLVYILKIFPKLSETFIASELAELRRRNIELRILSLLPPREEMRHQIIRRAGLDQITVYDEHRFAKVVEEFHPDLLHAHFATESTAVARELSLASGVPFTFTAHGYDIHRKPPPDFRDRAAAARAVITVSEANAHYISTAFGVPRDHVRVIPCGVDTEFFRPAQEALDTNEPWIVSVARHVKVKNLSLLLETCAELRRRGVSFRCAMVGDGPCRGELEEQRARLGLEQIVQMPGAAEQTEVLGWWQRATVGVLTSDNEGMPVSLMEAAACGVPVVSTNVGGVSELVKAGETGLLAAPADASGLADGLETLLRDPGLRARFSAAARRRAELTFSVSRQADSLLALWDQALDRAPRL